MQKGETATATNPKATNLFNTRLASVGIRTVARLEDAKLKDLESSRGKAQF